MIGMHLIIKPKYKGKSQFFIGDFGYDHVLPGANYAPWLTDSEFLKIYSEIKSNTLVDIYRCFELWELAGKICQLDREAHFIEIGVWRGGTSALIGRKLSLTGSRATFFMADTFSGVKKSSDKDTFYFDNEHSDTSEEAVLHLMNGKYEHYKILKGIFPDETANLVPDGFKFGLCHIDVDVYNSSQDIVNWIWNRMIVGGVIVFDDYGFHTCDGVTKYVNEQKGREDCMVIHNLNGHALMIKLK